MIRYSPIGLAIAILFVVFGPHNWFFASRRSEHMQVSPSALSSVLPDANTVGNQPTRGMVDAVETRQGYIVRTAGRHELVYELVAGSLLLVLAWPLRKMALSRKQNPPDADDNLS